MNRPYYNNCNDIFFEKTCKADRLHDNKNSSHKYADNDTGIVRKQTESNTEAVWKQIKSDTDTVRKQTNIFRDQYHPAFYEAMTYLFDKDTAKYSYNKELTLNPMANRIDFVIIKSDDNVSSYGLGKIFRKYNIFEYKSPGDALGVKEYYLAMAYAYLYSSYNNDVEINLMTLSFVRESRPVKLIKYFKDNGFDISTFEKGIIHVRKSGHIDMQIVVTRLLCDKYMWLKALTPNLTKDESIRLSAEALKEHDPEKLIHIKAIFELVISLIKDKEWVKELREMDAWDMLFPDKVQEMEKMRKEISVLNEQLQSKDEQLHNILENEKLEKSRLLKEIEQLKSKIAML